MTRAIGHELNVKRLWDEDWWQKAACADNYMRDGVDLFFRPDSLLAPEESRAWTPNAAFEICATCPVRLPCLVFTMENGFSRHFGVAAATTERDRRGSLLEAWKQSQENVDAVLGFRRCHECRETKSMSEYQRHHFAGYGRVCKTCLGARRKDRKNSRPQAQRKSRGGITSGGQGKADGGASVRRASVPNKEAG